MVGPHAAKIFCCVRIVALKPVGLRIDVLVRTMFDNVSLRQAGRIPVNDSYAVEQRANAEIMWIDRVHLRMVMLTTTGINHKKIMPALAMPVEGNELALMNQRTGRG